MTSAIGKWARIMFFLYALGLPTACVAIWRLHRSPTRLSANSVDILVSDGNAEPLEVEEQAHALTKDIWIRNNRFSGVWVVLSCSEHHSEVVQGSDGIRVLSDDPRGMQVFETGIVVDGRLMRYIGDGESGSGTCLYMWSMGPHAEVIFSGLTLTTKAQFATICICNTPMSLQMGFAGGVHEFSFEPSFVGGILINRELGYPTGGSEEIYYGGVDKIELLSASYECVEVRL